MVTERDDLDTGTNEAVTQIFSKTKGLQDWLDCEIKRELCDLYVLLRVLGENVGTDVLDGIPSDTLGDLCTAVRHRHQGKLSFERDQALADDREQLARVKRHLTLLYSAKELNIDIDAIEKWLGVEITVTYRREDSSLSYFPVSLSFLVHKNGVATRVHSFALGQRTIHISQVVNSVYVGAQRHGGISALKLSRESGYGGENACIAFSLEYGSLKILESSLVFFEKKNP